MSAAASELAVPPPAAAALLGPATSCLANCSWERKTPGPSCLVAPDWTLVTSAVPFPSVMQGTVSSFCPPLWALLFSGGVFIQPPCLCPQGPG